MPWYDGVWHDGDVVPFDIRDRGLLLGDGIFDTALVLGGKMVWRHYHVDRLLAAGARLGFRIDPAMVDRAIHAIVSRVEHGSVRITVTRGIGPRGLTPLDDATPMIFSTAGPLPASALFAPITLHVTAIRRNETSPTSRMKTLGYLDGILALSEARKVGCDDALFLNTHGRVACTSVGNLFALFDRQLMTPPLDDGVLDGVVRGILLRTCDSLGLQPIERSLSIDDLAAADAIFVTNSLRLLAPVGAIDGKPTNARTVAPIIDHLVRLVEDQGAVDPRTLATRPYEISGSVAGFRK